MNFFRNGYKRNENPSRNYKRTEKKPKYSNVSNKQSLSDEEIAHQLFHDDKKNEKDSPSNQHNNPDIPNTNLNTSQNDNNCFPSNAGISKPIHPEYRENDVNMREEVTASNKDD